MGKLEKLILRFQSSPNSVRFSDLCKLAEMVGFVLERVNGSHYLYFHPKGIFLNIQPKGKDAKPVQVKELLNKIKEHSL